jgi:ABC-type dipeptide/oligopeptide/nickel transport system permease component
MICVFLIIISMCFILVKLLPVTDAAQFGKDSAIVEMRREQLGYNKPLIVQYGIFIQKTLLATDYENDVWFGYDFANGEFKGMDWGMSEKLYFGRDVWDIFISKLPATMIVNVYTMLFAVPIGLLLGIYAALKKNKWQDHLISTGVMVLISVPGYVTCFLIQYFLCHKLKDLTGGWSFPLQMNPGTDYFSWDMFISLVPPIIALGLGTIAGLARYTRAELTEVLTSEFMLLARTKGLTRGQATVRHALRNSMVPIFPMIMGEFIGIIGGSLVVEKIFGIPGVGPLYLNSITSLDYNFYLLLNAFYTLIGLLSGIIVDLSYGFVDPRIRMGEK